VQVARSWQRWRATPARRGTWLMWTWRRS